MLLHFASVLHFAAIVITFCVSITFCGDYYILRRNKRGIKALEEIEFYLIFNKIKKMYSPFLISVVLLGYFIVFGGFQVISSIDFSNREFGTSVVYF